jgi:hypothetical protein
MLRERYHEPTKRYVTRRTAEGKSDREIRRCLKRTIARQLERTAAPGATPGYEQARVARAVRR